MSGGAQRRSEEKFGFCAPKSAILRGKAQSPAPAGTGARSRTGAFARRPVACAGPSSPTLRAAAPRAAAASRSNHHLLSRLYGGARAHNEFARPARREFQGVTVLGGEAARPAGVPARRRRSGGVGIRGCATAGRAT